MPRRLQALHQQALGAFDRNAADRLVHAQTLVQSVQAGDIVGERALMNEPPGRVEDAHLVLGVPPIQPNEHAVGRGRNHL
jgi:hypothetical protein